MNRFNRYQEFRNRIHRAYKKISASHNNPLGPDAISGIRTAEAYYRKLPRKWQEWIDNMVHKDMIAYHKPVVQGKNGEWYSSADMNAWYLNH
jgi:predicted anti-sigma-YlaC factor YlaD